MISQYSSWYLLIMIRHHVFSLATLAGRDRDVFFLILQFCLLIEEKLVKAFAKQYCTY
jgi:hypothetical protein